MAAIKGENILTKAKKKKKTRIVFILNERKGPKLDPESVVREKW